VTADSAPSTALVSKQSGRQLREKLIEVLVTAVAFIGVAAIALIFIFVAREALPLLFDPEAAKEVSLSKLFLPQAMREGKPPAFMWQPVSRVPKVSMVPLFLGTLKVSLVSMAVAGPLGLLAAVFTSELSPPRVREWLKPLVELLAGVPSVVLGFFALMVLATATQDTFDLPYRLNALVAGLAMALAIVPIIFTVAEDALTAVPRSYREASLALGATRWETAWRVVLPAAAPGVVAALVLGLGRAVGETMIVLMASGNAAIVSPSLTDSTRTLSATIAAEMGEVVVGSPHYSLLFLIGVQLFVVAFVLNVIAGAAARRLVRRLGGKASVA
jgi:phosphate transport system permease protein